MWSIGILIGSNLLVPTFSKREIATSHWTKLYFLFLSVFFLFEIVPDFTVMLQDLRKIFLLFYSIWCCNFSAYLPSPSSNPPLYLGSLSLEMFTSFPFTWRFNLRALETNPNNNLIKKRSFIHFHFLDFDLVAVTISKCIVTTNC